MSTREKLAVKEFRRYARRNLMNPKKVTRIEQTRHFIHELHQLIHEFRHRFDYVPDEAHLMFSEYQNIQDRMVYENFRQNYNEVLC